VSRNVEIKARVENLTPIRTRAATLTTDGSRTIDQVDTFFAVPHGRLKVRAFADGSGELIAYERTDEPGPKQSSYTRVECSDAAALCEALARVLQRRGVVAKHREVFVAGRTRIHLDVVEHLGAFVELEVVLADGESVEAGRREAHNLLSVLQIPESDLVPGAYIDLIERTLSGSIEHPI
jgi:predicted adenylyl cyclase CyaB